MESVFNFRECCFKKKRCNHLDYTSFNINCLLASIYLI